MKRYFKLNKVLVFTLSIIFIIEILSVIAVAFGMTFWKYRLPTIPLLSFTFVYTIFANPFIDVFIIPFVAVFVIPIVILPLVGLFGFRKNIL